MADYGFKIAKATKNVQSTDPTDYVFWSKYQSLPLLYKVTETIDVDSGDCSGTHIYTHSLGWMPFALGFVTSKITATRQAIPMFIGEAGNKTYCDGDNLSEQFTMTIKENTIEIDYEINCIIPMVSSRCIDVSTSYSVDLYLFMFELGTAMGS